MTEARMRPDESQLDELVRRIVEAVHPLKIILFGSAAREEMGRDSDVDLLVVMPEGTHRRDAAGEIYYRVRGVKLPFEVLVTTPDDLEKHRDNPGPIYRTILREGRTIYAARAGIALASSAVAVPVEDGHLCNLRNLWFQPFPSSSRSPRP